MHVGCLRTAILFERQKLLLGLPWYCADRPTPHEDGTVEWHFRWEPPPPSQLRGGIVLEPYTLSIGRDEVSFEGICQDPWTNEADTGRNKMEQSVPALPLRSEELDD